MKKKTLITILVLISMLASAIPAFAADSNDTIPLKVNNQSGKEFSLVLSGDGYYRFTVKNGANKFDIKSGKYTYSYNACDKDETGNLKVKKNGANLKIKKCKTGKVGSGDGRFKMRNFTGSPMTLTFSGAPGTFTFNVPTGKSAYRVPKGTYDYTVVASCRTFHGTVNIFKAMIGTFSCH